MRISDWSSDVCSSDLPARCNECHEYRKCHVRANIEVPPHCHCVQQHPHRPAYNEGLVRKTPSPIPDDHTPLPGLVSRRSWVCQESTRSQLGCVSCWAPLPGRYSPVAPSTVSHSCRSEETTFELQ